MVNVCIERRESHNVVNVHANLLVVSWFSGCRAIRMVGDIVKVAITVSLLMIMRRISRG